jgi:CRP-like cAMP-binding protein
MISPAQPRLSANRLLAVMPQATLARLHHQCTHVALLQGQLCFDAGDIIEHVYFPTSGLISLVISTETGELVEAGTVGREGAAGLQSALGPRSSFTRAIVQIPGTFYVVSADALRRAVETSSEAQALIIYYTEVLLAEAQQLSACNAIHPASPRLARWLLQCADRTGTEQILLTQELLGEMLGIRRTSVTLLAQDLQTRGIIKYSRGKIAILDRTALETFACECYRTITGLYRELPGHTHKQISEVTQLRA